jgi:hypothetical protein
MSEAFDKLHKTAERALQEIDRLMAENRELVERLRAQQCDGGSCNTLKFCACANMDDAADAIEALEAENKRLRSDVEELKAANDSIAIRYDRQRAALEKIARLAGAGQWAAQPRERSPLAAAAISCMGYLRQIAEQSLQGKPTATAREEELDPDRLREDALERRQMEREYPWKE